MVNKDFIFTFIINFCNSECYLEKCIESILNQTLDFEENIQLIFVNNGSLDNSLELLLKYQDDYPNNIIILDNPSEKRSDGWNLGLEYSKGKYINFFDEFDWLSEDSLKNVNLFFEKNYDEIDIVSIPIINVENNNKSNHVLNYKFNRSRIIDVTVNPNSPQVSISSSFIKHSAIEYKKFRTDLIYDEDTLFLNEIILDKLKYGIVFNAEYYYRIFKNGIRLYDKVRYNPEYYSSRLDNFHFNLIENSISRYGKILKYLQYILVYDLLNIFKMPKLNMFDEYSPFIKNEEEYNLPHNAEYNKEKFKEKLELIVSYIDEDVILNNKFITDDFEYKFLLFLKFGYDVEYDDELDEVNLVSNDEIIDNLNIHKLWIGNVNIVEDKLVIEGFYNIFFKENDLTLEIVNIDTDKVISAEIFEMPKRNSKSILSYELEPYKKFKFNIPIDDYFKFKIRWNINNINDCFVYPELGFYSIASDLQSRSILINDYRLFFKDLLFKFEKIFKVAVVMAIYNTERFLAEAIDSVVNQTLGFEENIQLILIDDGSEDNSLKICKEYKKKYPNNIVVISQENAGQAVARNKGLKEVHAEFINFLDSDDYISENSFENVYNFFKQHKHETDVVSFPIKFFGRFEGEHQLNFKFTSNRVIDLEQDPFNPQFHITSSFINCDVLEDVQFPGDIVPSEDAIVLIKILLRKRTLGVVKDATYYYRKRYDMSSTLDDGYVDKEKVTGRLKKYFLGLFKYAEEKYGRVPRFLEFTMAQDLHWILNEPDLNFAKNQLDAEEFFYYLHKILDYISVDTINNLIIGNEDLRTFYLYMKMGDLDINIHDSNIVSLNIGKKQIDQLNYHKLWLDIVEIKDNFLLISGLYMGLIGNKYLSIQGENELSNGDIEYTLADENYYQNRGDRDFLGKKWKYALNFDLKIPIYSNLINRIKIKVNFHIDEDNTNFSKENIIPIYLDLGLQHYTNITDYSNYFVNGPYLLVFKDNCFNITPYSYKDMLKCERPCIKKIYDEKLYYYKHILVIRLFYVLSYPLIRRLTKNKPIYLFMDRIDSAHDNGEVLWKYALSQKDNIKKYFIIDKNSEDYNRLSKIGNVIAFKSLKHQLMFLFADKIISSHPEEDVLNPFFSREFDTDTRRFVAGLITLKRYFIEHGVAQYNLSDWLKKYNINIHYYLTSSDFETEGEFKNLSYPREIYHTLGMPRFDILENNVSKQILICPTWRFKIMGDDDKAKLRFINSEYYKFLQSILNNDRLIELSEKHGCKLIFKPHPRLTHIVDCSTEETYVDLLNIPKNIEISYNESYTELLSNSALMITDYSSVAFDFAYLEKPLIYYQADEIPHERGYFDYETMGFGDVILDENLLMDKIEFFINNNFTNEDKYIQRKRLFFKYQDKNNSKRVYDSIK